jgi:hypothetical protein
MNSLKTGKNKFLIHHLNLSVAVAFGSYFCFAIAVSLFNEDWIGSKNFPFTILCLEKQTVRNDPKVRFLNVPDWQ